jgi:hypothetical protein
MTSGGNWGRETGRFLKEIDTPDLSDQLLCGGIDGFFWQAPLLIEVTSASSASHSLSLWLQEKPPFNKGTPEVDIVCDSGAHSTQAASAS